MLPKKHRSLWPISYLLVIVLLTACVSNRIAPPPTVIKGSPAVPSPTTSPTRTLGAPGCHPPSPLDQSNLGLPEAQGTATGTELYALFLGGVPPAKTQIKIIWKATSVSTLEFHVVALGPHGLHVRPTFGPELHSGSNWQRPGGEWGTGFSFPVAGCWDLHVTDENAVGDVWIVVT